MKNILLKIEYEGTRFKGWQIQPQVITVEETIKTVLQQICQCNIQIRASSRTDAGVHARGQVATVQVPDHIFLNRLICSVNSLLPEDISVSDAVEVPPEFSARMNNCGKRYIYQILNSPFARALHHRFYNWVRAPLNLTQMRSAGSFLKGTHDYSAFRGRGCQQNSTVKTVRKLDILTEDMDGYTNIRIMVEGDGFLKNMVRIMIGTLIDIGRGKLDEGSIQRALTSGRREDTGLTAPAKGLILDRVYFDPDPFAEYKEG